MVDCGKKNVSAEVEMYSTDQEDEAEMEREKDDAEKHKASPQLPPKYQKNEANL